MATGHTFREFGELVDELESAGADIIDITPHEEQVFTGESLSLDVSVGVPLFEDIDTSGVEITPQDPDVQMDGTLTVDFSVRVPTDQDLEASEPDLEPSPDHSEEVAETETEPEDTSELQQAEIKPHRDPDRLQEVYEECETFEEMTVALEADVTPETVRSNMIKQGIHHPKTNGTDSEDAEETVSTENTEDGVETEDTGGETGEGEDTHQSVEEVEQPPEHNEETGGTDVDANEAAVEESEPADSEEKTIVSDGLGLPEGMTLDELKTIVHTSRSFLDVQRKLDGDRDYTYRILKELDLIDLVHGRLSKKAEREPSLEEIERRIQRSMTPLE